MVRGWRLCETGCMEAHALPASAPALPHVDVPVWAWALVVLAAVVSYFVMLENGVVLSQVSETLHEFFHDGRHFAGVPCH